MCVKIVLDAKKLVEITKPELLSLVKNANQPVTATIKKAIIFTLQ